MIQLYKHLTLLLSFFLSKKIFQEKNVVLDQASYSLEEHVKRACDANLVRSSYFFYN